MTRLTIDDSVRIAELRLLAARSEFRDARETHERARRLLYEADLALRRLLEPPTNVLPPQD